MRYGLEEKVINDVKAVFSTFPEVDEVILFGSRAKGNYKDGSDIDMVLKGERLDLSHLNKISLKLDALFLPNTFDLSIFAQIDNMELLEHIKRVGIPFYKRPGAL